MPSNRIGALDAECKYLKQSGFVVRATADVE